MKHKAYGLCFVLIDHILFVLVKIVPQGRLTAGGFALPGVMLQRIYCFLARYQNLRVIEHRCCSFIDEYAGVFKISSHHWLRHTGHPCSQHIHVFPELKPLGKFAEHTALVINNHKLRAAHAQVHHTGFITGTGLFHAGNSFIGEYFSHLITIALTPFTAFFHLNVDSHGILIVC